MTKEKETWLTNSVEVEVLLSTHPTHIIITTILIYFCLLGAMVTIYKYISLTAINEVIVVSKEQNGASEILLCQVAGKVINQYPKGCTVSITFIDQRLNKLEAIVIGIESTTFETNDDTILKLRLIHNSGGQRLNICNDSRGYLSLLRKSH